MVDDACHQPLRATIDPLLLYGPGVRVGVDKAGCKPTSLILRRWPVLSVVSVQVAPNRLPWTFTPVPSTDYQIAYPVAGIYGSSAPAAAAEGGQEVLLAPRWVDWCRGHQGYVIEVQYVNGWPHAGLTQNASPVTSGAQAITVDDCTGWAVTSPYSGFTGATGVIYDSGAQEVIHVTAASASQGPGTLTLASPLQYAHGAGVMVSTLPPNVGWAAIMFCISQALARGATSTTVHQIPGGPAKGSSPGPADWAKCAKAALSDYARII